MIGKSNTIILVGLISIVVLNGCGSSMGGATEVIAWPGMNVAEFNRLNAGNVRQLKSSDTDWIGINSPVTLVFRQGSETLRFSGTRMGGGIQILSSNLTPDFRYNGPAHIRSISFNIGGGMEEIAKQKALLVDRCNGLARMAGLATTMMPDLDTLGERLRSHNGHELEVCGGQSATLSFGISAMHYEKDLLHGGDYGRAYFDGYLGTPSGETSIN